MSDWSRPENGWIVHAANNVSYQMDTSIGKGNPTTVVPVITVMGITIGGLSESGVATMLDGARPQAGDIVLAPNGVAYQKVLSGNSVAGRLNVKDTSVFFTPNNPPVVASIAPWIIRSPMNIINDAIAFKDLVVFLLTNPATVYATQQGWFPELFNAAGFIRDENGVYHAKQDCWQAIMGYNVFYDIGASQFIDIIPQRFQFDDGANHYMLWAWKGNYGNLGVGAEMGVYTNNNGSWHWEVDKSLSMPMTLSLGDKNGNYFNYYPREDQWWVTGFDPSKQTKINPNDLTATFTVDFKDHTDLYNAFTTSENFIRDNSPWKKAEQVRGSSLNAYKLVYTFK
jgi:hypothetical protein